MTDGKTDSETDSETDGETDSKTDGIGLTALARAGAVEELLRVTLSTDDPEHLAYKWLSVAADFGHADAEEAIEDVRTGLLYADDDNYVSGHAHFELGVAYLTGADGLPLDTGLARRHLAAMLRCGYPASVQGGADLLTAARAGLSPASAEVFDAALRLT